MKQTIYFYEGETEKHLLDTLKANNIIVPGKAQKCNLWQKPVEKVTRRFQKSDLVFIIDTDTTQPHNTFVNNVRHLLKIKISFCLMIQIHNLEDELCFACNKNNKNALYRDFYACLSAAEFKSRFNKDNNLYQTLKREQFHADRLWQRSNQFKGWLDTRGIQPLIERKIFY